MLKTRKRAITMLLTFIIMLVLSLSMNIKANAVFDNNFNVSWSNNGVSSVTGAANNMNGSFEKIIEKYKTVITFLSAIGAVTMIGVFIFCFMKLGTTSGNPQERSKVITGLIVSGIAAAGLGAVSLIVGIFYGMLKD